MFELIFSTVRAIHQIRPELRFQQIMTIAANMAGWKKDDLFYCPDEMIKKGLIIMLEKMNQT